MRRLSVLVLAFCACAAAPQQHGPSNLAAIHVEAAPPYKLQKGSARLVRELSRPMHVDAYLPSGTPSLDAFAKRLGEILDSYARASHGKFDYAAIDATHHRSDAKAAGLVELPLTAGENAETGYSGLAFKLADESDTIRALDPMQPAGIEFWITNKIREVRWKAEGARHTIGVLAQHDEIKLSEPNLVPSSAGNPSMSEIIQRNFAYYRFVDVDLKNGNSEIDSSLDALIVTQPRKEITDAELRRIDQFVMKGKSLAVFASSVNVNDHDATMTATLDAHGLDKLLGGYGIEMLKNVVFDFNSHFTMKAMAENGEISLHVPAVVDVVDDARFQGNDARLDTTFPILFRIGDVALPFASSITLHKEKQPDVKPEDFKVILRSTPVATERNADTVDLNPFQTYTRKGRRNQFDLAATLRGRVRSAFSSAQVPEGRSARIVVFSASQFLANPFARAGNPEGKSKDDERLLQLASSYAQQSLTNTILVFKNTLDWMILEEDLIEVSSSIQ